ncbi:1,4-alpha-glucan branching protein GlgB [Fundidesulfovibrio putealis]|uniref:1,4-alpha-glucan branching protein GlgB n=1 Tax=Fundidesulfovibrio putealis TaxID=270496 RepID=UPI000488ADF4|nr:1,4-alpha-glucan branching protein GlgB [Fundidesulfovibrio putealis]
MSTPITIPPFDLYLFGRGEHWDIYRILGAHPHQLDGAEGFRFAVWAPDADEVSVLGDWNGWHYGATPLHPVGVSGIWAGFVAGVARGQLYKFAVRGKDGHVHVKTDPYSFYAELRPGTASVAWGLGGHEWGDGDWMERRARSGLPLDKPVSIYELHPGSWRWKGPYYGDFLSYHDLADQLIPYLTDLGFTHIQLMPVAEHPLDESWGYQTGHYFAPTSRFGAPEDFKYFVDRCHQAGLSVLLDWVPGHFPKDSWALGRFDGTALYEHSDPRQGEHPDWGTFVFNYSRHEVRNFLLANALYWLEEFHIDGLRIDAVASMLYLDYSRKEGEWVPNVHGGNENLEAVSFLRDLNTVVHKRYPGAIMAAEESTSWAGVSRPVYAGGLGFTFKWNMGWMNDTLDYFAKDPVFRGYHQNTLTFSMLYAFHENFILPMSHDEVTHGKGALISKMPGDDWQKFANLRCFLSYMWGHPGKKLLFMGGEFAQWREWSSREPLDWALLEFPNHQGVVRAVRDLNRLLKAEPALHQMDNEWSGFEWIDLTDYQSSVISFLRKAKDGSQLMCVYNFTPVTRHHYALGSRHDGYWREVFNSDAPEYGGSGVGNGGGVQARPAEIGLWPYYVSLTLPPLGALYFKAE